MEAAKETEVSREASSSSLKEPFVGNVSRFTPLPPDADSECSAEKGLLQFDACFEEGEN